MTGHQSLDPILKKYIFCLTPVIKIIIKEKKFQTKNGIWTQPMHIHTLIQAQDLERLTPLPLGALPLEGGTGYVLRS